MKNKFGGFTFLVSRPTTRLQGSNPGLPHCRWILYHLSYREARQYWSGYPVPSPWDLPNPGIEPESPALQVDSLPADLTREAHKKRLQSENDKPVNNAHPRYGPGITLLRPTPKGVPAHSPSAPQLQPLGHGNSHRCTLSLCW